MTEFKNIYIYVSDALRYDYVPDSIAEEGNVIPTLTPGSYTPISFSSMLTGMNPSNHNVRSFYDTLENKTFFDLFENHCYYDHPDSAMASKVFKNHTTSKELSEMEEPFLHVERALDTHTPYGEVGHGNDIPEDQSQEGDKKKLYQEGVKNTEKHFWDHVEELKELGLYEDTLIIFTSDHGELNGEKKLFQNRYGHNKPVCKELNIGPTVFLNYEEDNWDRARLIDLIPTALDIIREGSLEGIDGKSLNKELPSKGETMIQVSMKPPIIAKNNWYYKGEWEPGFSKIKPDIATVISDHLDKYKWKFRKWYRSRKKEDIQDVELLEDVEV
jgi:hypothetical protein